MKYLEGLNFNEPASAEELGKIPSMDRLPVDYVEFMKRSNGGHGSVGKEHLIVFPAQDISSINQVAAVDRFAPGLLIFASNGGGQSYAFDLRHEVTSIVKFYDMDLGDEEPVWCAHTFGGLLAHLMKS